MGRSVTSLKLDLKPARLAFLRKVVLTHAGLDLNQVSVFSVVVELPSYFFNGSVSETAYKENKQNIPYFLCSLEPKQEPPNEVSQAPQMHVFLALLHLSRIVFKLQFNT